jgi:hypothetical protein
LGGIDLDPCSDSHTEPNVPARAHYTAADDGLAKDWHGTVFCNPPYSQVQAWIRKLLAEHRAVRVHAAVLLVKAAPETRWWRLLDAHPRCYIRGRLVFSNAPASAPFPSAAFYLGPDIPRFVAAFRDRGAIELRGKEMVMLPFRWEADLIPDMSPAEYEALVDDIRAHGQREPIVRYQGAILDGRHRYTACLALGMEPRFREFDPATEGSPLAFVWSANRARRNLSPSQLVALGVAFAQAISATEGKEAQRRLPAWSNGRVG